MSHVGDILTAMWPTDASRGVGTAQDRACRQGLPYVPAEEVSSGIHAIEAMEVLSAKVMSLFTCHHQQRTLSARTMAVPQHSYQSQRAGVQDVRYTKPKGFEVRHMNFDSEDQNEMVRAYRADASPFHKVDLRHVYAVTTDGDEHILTMLKGQITLWLGKQIFAIIPPGAEEPLLYTPASASMKRWGDPAVLSADERLDRMLVPLIPKDAQIKMPMLDKFIVVRGW